MFDKILGKKKIIVDPKKIKEILTRGVEDVFVKENLEKKLLSGKVLRVKLGFDPTGSKIHIGRSIALRKLKAFQDLGHIAVFVVGNFTAQIGDPSDKTDKRPMLSEKEIEDNLKNYKKQVGNIINLKRAEFHYNSKWLSKLGFQEISELAESFTVQQMANRRNFKERFEKGEEVSLREFLYPLMQGYDSVAVRADIEIGGLDQLFNLKAGRIIQRYYNLPEQDILTTQMIEGTDGRKMSTSWGNVITITDESNDMFGKIMSIKDELIVRYFTLVTDVSEEEIHTARVSLERGANPRDLKMRLAEKVVSLFHNKEAAKRAREYFCGVFQRKELPTNLPEFVVVSGSLLGDFALSKKFVKSKSDWRRLVAEGAISDMETGEKITNPIFRITKNTVLKIGKKNFAKLNVQ